MNRAIVASTISDCSVCGAWPRPGRLIVSTGPLALLDRLGPCRRPVPILLALDDEHGTADAGQDPLDVPRTKLRLKPEVGPAQAWPWCASAWRTGETGDSRFHLPDLVWPSRFSVAVSGRRHVAAGMLLSVRHSPPVFGLLFIGLVTLSFIATRRIRPAGGCST